MLATRSLTFGYQPELPLIVDWSAEFARGEVVAITGPSGRGKSTLLYLLGLMLRPSAGEVMVDGMNAAGLSDHERARLRAHKFGFVFQDSALDATRTVLDNVVESALYRGDARRPAISRARGLLDRFGVELRADARPGQVSGGQAQRIALCRALLGDPNVLLADEPTGNLDPASSQLVLDAFRDHADANNVVVVVTHDPAVASRCDRVITL